MTMKLKIKLIQLWLDIVLGVSVLFNLLVSPYTKVEESFNIQAVHDMINIGLDDLELFDHVSFPGPVKRTAVGAIFFSLPSIYLPLAMQKLARFLTKILVFIHTVLPTPLHELTPKDMELVFSQTKIQQLLVSRFILGMLVVLSLIHLKNSINYSCSKNSKLVGLVFSLLCYPLPHLLYYSSRFLPNFICFPLTNLAISMFISGDLARSITVFVFVGIIFRFEVLIFTGILLLFCITGIHRNRLQLLSIREATVSVAVSAILAIYLGSRLDSYFWNVGFTLPELESFFFNVIEGNSADWGTEPYYAYFFKYLPKLFASNLEIVPLSVFIFVVVSMIRVFYLAKKDKKFRSFNIDLVNYDIGTLTTLICASITYVCVLSINGHKEWRFLVYIIPIFCFAASSAILWMIESIDKKYLKVMLIGVVVISYVLSLLSSFIFGFISSWNYTGGDTVQKLNLRLLNTYRDQKDMFMPVSIHWDVGTCMNGGSLFTQLADNKISPNSWINTDDNKDMAKYWVVYDKTETSEELHDSVDYFDYWIQYDEEEILPLNGDQKWLLVDVTDGYSGLNKRFILDLIKDPVRIVNELLGLNFSYFQNILDQIIVKETKGKVWEKSGSDSISGNTF